MKAPRARPFPAHLFPPRHEKFFPPAQEKSRLEKAALWRVMDRATIKQHLALAEEHVAKSQKHIVRQRELIAELERYGHTWVTEEARRLLAQFLELDVLHVANRDRLKQKLDG